MVAEDLHTVTASTTVAQKMKVSKSEPGPPLINPLPMPTNYRGQYSQGLG